MGQDALMEPLSSMVGIFLCKIYFLLIGKALHELAFKYLGFGLWGFVGFLCGLFFVGIRQIFALGCRFSQIIEEQFRTF